MKNYVAPAFEVIVVNITDVIATSSIGSDQNDNEFDATEIFP